MDFQQLAKMAAIRSDMVEKAQTRVQKLIDFSIEDIAATNDSEPVGIQILACVLHLNFWLHRYTQAVGCTPQQAMTALMNEVAKHYEAADNNASS